MIHNNNAQAILPNFLHNPQLERLAREQEQAAENTPAEQSVVHFAQLTRIYFAHIATTSATRTKNSTEQQNKIEPLLEAAEQGHKLPLPSHFSPLSHTQHAAGHFLKKV